MGLCVNPVAVVPAGTWLGAVDLWPHSDSWTGRRGKRGSTCNLKKRMRGDEQSEWLLILQDWIRAGVLVFGNTMATIRSWLSHRWLISLSHICCFLRLIKILHSWFLCGGGNFIKLTYAVISDCRCEAQTSLSWGDFMTRSCYSAQKDHCLTINWLLT